MNIPHMAGEKPNKPLPYLLLIPVMLFLAVFTFFPFFRSIYLSFFITDQLGNTGKFVGFANYLRVFKDRNFINSVKVTIKFAAMVCTGTFSLAMLLALLCVNPVKGSKIYQTMFALPIAVASVSVSAIFKYLFQQSGLINNLLGTNINWLADASYALPVTAFVTVWSGVGTSFIFLLVGFRNVPDDLIESSVIDGANSFQRALKIMIPIASPQIFFVLFLNIISSFKAFGVIKVLVGSGPRNSTNIIVYALYSNAFIRGRFETACVYSIVLCALIFVVTRVQLLCEKRVVHY